MHGSTSSHDVLERPGIVTPVRDWLSRHWLWCTVVLLPTLLVAGYYYLIAADQYESEAHFVVRTANTSASSPTGLGQALTMVGATSSQADAMVVEDYLSSHDAVSALQARINLVGRFRRPEADVVSRIRSTNPSPERLLKYYLGKVDIKVHSDSGITDLQVRAFRPADSLAIIDELLTLSEERINMMNRRNYASAVAAAQRQVDEAEQYAETVQSQLTSFRRSEGDFNPQTTGNARVTMVAQLQGRLSDARAQEAAMASAVSAKAPQLVALRARVAALQKQVAAEQARLASGPGNVATGLGTYESLQLRQDLAGKQYEVASASLQKAREEAVKQQLFLVRVVDPNLPVKSLFPRRGKIVLTVFLALLLTYGFGWLIVAGVREHAA